jgi:hypothetical protein
LTATPDAIARLKELCRQGDEELRAVEGPPPPQLDSDADIERTLIGLIAETSAAARKAFRLADLDAHPGGSAEAWGIAVGQGARAAQACAQLAEGLAKVRGKLEQRVVIEHRRTLVVASPVEG